MSVLAAERCEARMMAWKDALWKYVPADDPLKWTGEAAGSGEDPPAVFYAI